MEEMLSDRVEDAFSDCRKRGLKLAREFFDNLRRLLVCDATKLDKLGTFAFILSMQTKDRQVEEIADLAGLSKTNPYRALILTILMFSLAGIPPLAGFFAKWYVFLAAIQANLLALSIIGVLASVVGAYYYLRIIKIMWFDEPAAGFVAAPSLINAVLGISGAFVLFYVIVGGPVEALAAAAAKTFF